MAKNECSNQELIRCTAERLAQSGISITETVLELAVKSYLEVKRDKILEGYQIPEPGIGTLGVSVRKVSNAFSPRQPYTAKLVTSIDGELKSQLIDRIGSDQSFREMIGAGEL